MIIGEVRQDNSGYSLVELLTVISIMMVITGVAALSLSLAFSQDAKRAAVIIDDELTETRMLSMSKAGVITMTIHTDADGMSNTIEIKEGTNPLKIVPVDKKVKISLKGSASADPGNDIIIEFDKSSGRVVNVNGAVVDNGMYEIEAVAQRGRNKTATVTLVANTGKHYINK